VTQSSSQRQPEHIIADTRTTAESAARVVRDDTTRLQTFRLVRNSVYTVGVLFSLGIAGTVVVGFTGGDASTVSAMLTAVTGVIGSLVGAYFGVQLGSEGRQQVEERAEGRRRDAEEMLNRALAMLSREDAARVLGMELPRSNVSGPAPDAPDAPEEAAPR
jgi:hypothetical protein